MNISEIKDLLAQFDASTLREFSYKNNGEVLNLSKNQTSSVTAAPVAPTVDQKSTNNTFPLNLLMIEVNKSSLLTLVSTWLMV